MSRKGRGKSGKGGGPLILIGAGAGLLFAMSRSKTAKAATAPASVVLPPMTVTVPAADGSHLYGPPLTIGKNFDLSEFLRSETFPQVAQYKLTADELSNLKNLVTKILQPIRDQSGEMVLITSGGRPDGMVLHEDVHTSDLTGQAITIPSGSTFSEAMKMKGYDVAEHSDHVAFAAANFEIWDANKTPDPAALEKAFASLQDAAKFPDVRQVILYRTSDGKANNIHVAVIYPGHPRISDKTFAFEAHAS